VSAPGTYTVTATDVNGCEAVASQVVTFNALPVVDLGDRDTLCAGATITLDAGPGFTAYAWNTGGSVQTETISATGFYTVTVTDANGCQNTSTIEIIASTIPPVNLPATERLCDSGMVMLDAGPQYIAYNWAGGGTSINQYLIVDQPGVYSVTVVDQFGCSSTDNVTVTADGVMALDFMADTARVCQGENLILDAGDQWEYYLWDGVSGDQYLVVTTTGQHDVIVTDANGCRFSDQVTVVLETPPTLDLGPLVNICPDETLTVSAGAGFDSYLWSTGQTSASIEVTQPGIYSVTTTYNICTLDDETAIGDDCPGQIFIPNVFSPNGDGLNDFFEITFVNLEYLDISIYDRWGKFVYSSGDKNFKWNGTRNGKPLPEGAYYYHVNYKFNTNENPLDAKGTVMILR
jgi:gliding motility-associated-like protein